ncbi:MAG TPA: alpha-ketoglutarate-dependent dioxygenase AlkB [Casimicrobiaceae bacterium]|nr:alpha-ketoglutarate-dependent dioxygenase AlkB [Casimicrobiaceae bacterium]
MTTQDAATLDLFAGRAALPNGFVYRPEFIAAHEEAALLAHIATLSLHEAQYKTYTARRRVASFGSSYDFSENALNTEPPIPEWLLPLRDKVATWLDVPAPRFAHALVTEYRPGTALGWHRDVPQFAIVIGISLASMCRMRFRPYMKEPVDAEGQRRRRAETFELELAPRSAYVLRDDVRWRWQHSIPTTRTLRYSITFRTMRETR